MSSDTGIFAELVTLLGSGAVFALVARQVLSFRKWSRQTSLFAGLETLTEPWLVPVRRYLPRLGGVDLSPWVAAAMAALMTVVLRLLLSRGIS